MSEKEAYDHLIQWLDKSWWKFVPSDELMPIIITHFTPEEAALLTGIPFSSKSLEELAHIKDMTPAELGPELDRAAKKGMVFKTVRGESVRYRLNDSFFSLLRANFWPGKRDETIKATAPMLNRYISDGWFDQYKDVHTKGLRALPIYETVEDTRQILPYEDVAKVVDGMDYYCVTTCPCRHRHNLDPDVPDCKHPTEVCLHFDELAHYIVDNGMGREITKEETLEILELSADSGLVHGVSNHVEKVDTICNCCSCCCIWLEAYHKLGHTKSMDPSNYKVEVKKETCTGCALCVKRCPMDALQLKVSTKARNKYGKAAVVSPELCIGCGVCVHKCPSDSLLLVRNEDITLPPENPRKFMEAYLNDVQRAREKRAEVTA
ncbi:MAG: 4Fe-4S binding protein [Thermodesulfobacteriota bacterium]|nr:4Fe-4S binding protein [Thermodesulfobacteriota bacterium]